MAQMTLSSLNYGAPITTKSTGLGRGFSTPQRAKVERPMQFQTMDSMSLQNFSKPKANTIQPFGQLQPLGQTDISNQSTNVFSSPDLLNTFNSALRENLSYGSSNPNLSVGSINSARMDILRRVATQGGPLSGTEYGRLNSYNNIPKAGQALSEPYKPNKVAGAGSSSFDYSNFGNVLKSIKEEQDVYKRVSDPNFKLLSEDEMSKLADERFKKEWANRSWQDLYTPIDPAQHEKTRQEIIKNIKAGKASKTQLGMFEKHNTNQARKEDAMSLFNRGISRARDSYLSDLRQDNATRQYFDTEEGKKRIEAGKKLLDFYGTKTGLADNTSYLYGQNETDQRYKGAAFTFYDMYGDPLSNPATEYQKRYADELKKLKEEKFAKRLADPELNVSLGITKEDYQKIRDTIAGDFNKSVGLTGEFVPFGYNKFNTDALTKSYYESNPINFLTGAKLDDKAMKKEATRRMLNIAPGRPRWNSIWDAGGYADRLKNPGATRPMWSIY